MSAGATTITEPDATTPTPGATGVGTIPFATLLERGPRSGSPHTQENRRSVPAWVEHLFRIPLPGKLIGANALLVVAAIVAVVYVRRHDAGDATVVGVAVAAFLAVLLVNIALVALAVRPIHVLERTVDRIWHGDLSARVPESLLADRHVARVGRMFNILLDGLLADRARTRRLATELIHAGDRERSAISRELHDSTAQSLAGLSMQLSVLAKTAAQTPPDHLREQLERAQSLAMGALEEVRLLAHTMYPRVLEDLGLVAALKRLARETQSHTGIPVTVTTDDEHADVRGDTASVLYRVAQEAVRNATYHAAPTSVEVHLTTFPANVTLRVVDDGSGFDLERATREHPGMGLFTMRERVALVDGTIEIHTSLGRGTSIVASVPRLPSPTVPLAGLQR